MNLADYVEAGMALTEDERLSAARQLLVSVDRDPATDQAGIDAAWEAEVDRRLDDIVSGRVTLVSGEQTRAMGRARLAARTQ